MQLKAFAIRQRLGALLMTTLVVQIEELGRCLSVLV